jgi:hypothetical protein
MDKSLNLHRVGPGGIVLHVNVADSDTPAMVYDSLKRRYSSTFDCALAMGTIDDTVELNDAQCAWLDTFQDHVAMAFDVARAGMPEYE